MTADAGTSRRVVVADDDGVANLVICTILRSAGFAPVAAFDAMQALMLAMKAPEPIAIILDLNMPGGGGFETLKKLKSSSRTTAIPVLVVSSDTSEDAPAKAIGLGAAAFLGKPVVDRDLLAKIETAVAGGAAFPNLVLIDSV